MRCREIWLIPIAQPPISREIFPNVFLVYGYFVKLQRPQKPFKYFNTSACPKKKKHKVGTIVEKTLKRLIAR